MKSGSSHQIFVNNKIEIRIELNFNAFINDFFWNLSFIKKNNKKKNITTKTGIMFAGFRKLIANKETQIENMNEYLKCCLLKSPFAYKRTSNGMTAMRKYA